MGCVPQAKRIADLILKDLVPNGKGKQLVEVLDFLAARCFGHLPPSHAPLARKMQVPSYIGAGGSINCDHEARMPQKFRDVAHSVDKSSCRESCDNATRGRRAWPQLGLRAGLHSKETSRTCNFD